MKSLKFLIRQACFMGLLGFVAGLNFLPLNLIAQASHQPRDSNGPSNDVWGGFDQYRGRNEQNQRTPGIGDSAIMEAVALQQKAEWEYQRLLYAFYHTENLKHRLSAFQWQAFSGKIIFVFVLLVVFIGILFSGIHFYASYRRMTILNNVLQNKSEPATVSIPTVDQSDIEVSTSGLKVSSSVIGIVILVLSLAFLYMYLIHVYPIDELKLEHLPKVEQIGLNPKP